MQAFIYQNIYLPMKENLCYVVVGLAMLFLSAQPMYGQSETKTVSLAKGEVLDILLLRQNEGTDADLQAYFQTAFPVAKRMSYQNMPGFKVKEHTQGNHRPASLILGKWSDMKTREAFLTQILEEVPDFHERRRKIWSYFGLSYFEMGEDLSFEIDRGKYHVATAYWLKTENHAGTFYKKWTREINKMGGKVLLHLNDGTSPAGYRYDPDYFVVTSWENEAAFLAFQEKIHQLAVDNILHVNELILE